MDARDEAARGLIDIEGFLYRNAHLEAARRRVADFTARARELSPEQKLEIEQWYLDEQQYVARMVTDHIADSINTVEQRHHARIRQWMRGTLTAMVLVTLAMVACVVVVLASTG
ncbi:hypothetical protein [Streptomyces cylindrosporus]|uniref:Uncharacterized protein n=1 Tax=Streptomyces cylindrosporus TaxID=2927583 RepID=A0ABS9YLH2_9ACTN|nr:hypothetical protein [Streptomyces cylindrosporus]MCI3278128.1 hypothetical protein [Streptomyces cylindrosporus]